MIIRRALLFVPLVCAAIAGAKSSVHEPLRAEPATLAVTSPPALPLMFERIDGGGYGARSRGYTVGVSSEGVAVSMAGGEGVAPAQVRLSFSGATPSIITAEEPLDTVVNYLKGG